MTVVLETANSGTTVFSWTSPMAGDWIKIEYTLLSKPEVMAMAARFDVTEFEIVGHLVAFWCWVDSNMSLECPAVIGTKRGLDRVCGRDGMVDALMEVGWLLFDGQKFSVPNLDRHLSKGAKQRILEARKKKEQRERPASVPEESPECPEANGTKNGHLFSSLLSYDSSVIWGEIHIPESLTSNELKDIERWVIAMQHDHTFTFGSLSLGEKLMQAARYKREGHSIAELVSKAIAGSWAQLYRSDETKAEDVPADMTDTFLQFQKIAREHGGDTNGDRDWRKKNMPIEWHRAMRQSQLKWSQLLAEHPLERLRNATLLLKKLAEQVPS